MAALMVCLSTSLIQGVPLERYCRVSTSFDISAIKIGLHIAIGENASPERFQIFIPFHFRALLSQYFQKTP